MLFGPGVLSKDGEPMTSGLRVVAMTRYHSPGVMMISRIVGHLPVLLVAGLSAIPTGGDLMVSRHTVNGGCTQILGVPGLDLGRHVGRLVYVWWRQLEDVGSV